MLEGVFHCVAIETEESAQSIFLWTGGNFIGMYYLIDSRAKKN